MFSGFILTVCLLSWTNVHGLIVPWAVCPDVELGEKTEYDCDLLKDMWMLTPLAHVPGGSNSLTVFHNPYEPLNCVFFYFICRKDLAILGDLHLLPRFRGSLVCPAFNILLEQSGWKLQLQTNPRSKECQTVDRWMSLDIFIFRQGDFIFTYGCRKMAENLPVTIGAWILCDINATSEKREAILSTTRQLALKIPGFRDDWWYYPDANERCTSNGTCDYLANCQISPDAHEMMVPPSNNLLTVYMMLGPLLFATVIVLLHAIVKNVLRGMRERQHG